MASAFCQHAIQSDARAVRPIAQAMRPDPRPQHERVEGSDQQVISRMADRMSTATVRSRSTPPSGGGQTAPRGPRGAAVETWLAPTGLRGRESARPETQVSATMPRLPPPVFAGQTAAPTSLPMQLPDSAPNHSANTAEPSVAGTGVIAPTATGHGPDQAMSVQEAGRLLARILKECPGIAAHASGSPEQPRTSRLRVRTANRAIKPAARVPSRSGTPTALTPPRRPPTGTRVVYQVAGS